MWPGAYNTAIIREWEQIRELRKARRAGEAYRPDARNRRSITKLLKQTEIDRILPPQLWWTYRMHGHTPGSETYVREAARAGQRPS